jgi:hypothetical protein
MTARNDTKSKAICKIERQEKRVVKEAKKQVRSLSERLKELIETEPSMTPVEAAKSMLVLREYCIARAHDELSSEEPLTKESWQALSMAGMLQDQSHKDIEHAQKMKQYEAGLDGLIQFCFLGEKPDEEKTE